MSEGENRRAISLAETHRAERDRVAALIRRDAADHAREIVRKAAEIEVAEGKTVSIGDAVVEPTPEWLEKGPTRTFTPRLEDGTVKTVKAYRRERMTILTTMYRKDKITDVQLAACLWYRERHDVAGLAGRFKTSNISLAGNVGGGGGTGQAPMALHEIEAVARAEFRAARAALPAFYLRFFDAIVINDIPLRRAARFARCRDDRAQRRFREICAMLVDHCDQAGVAVDEACDSGD